MDKTPNKRRDMKTSHIEIMSRRSVTLLNSTLPIVEARTDLLLSQAVCNTLALDFQ
jgi:hypothetical protein